MKKLFLGCVALGLCGCTVLKTTIIERGVDGSERETQLRISTLWDSKSDLAKFKTTNTDKTQSLGIGTYSSESESTNIVALIQAVATGVAKGVR
jgi:hypothetical protein